MSEVKHTKWAVFWSAWAAEEEADVPWADFAAVTWESFDPPALLRRLIEVGS